jgi:hypothetical protein
LIAFFDEALSYKRRVAQLDVSNYAVIAYQELYDKLRIKFPEIQIIAGEENIHTWGMENMSGVTLVEVAGFGFDDEDSTEIGDKVYEIDMMVALLEELTEELATPFKR